MPEDDASVPHGHVPIAFLLGTRAPAYETPPHQRRREQLRRAASTASYFAPGVFSHELHVRRREAAAESLLRELLGAPPEVTNPNIPSPPPRAISSADRRVRRAELCALVGREGSDVDEEDAQDSGPGPSPYLTRVKDRDKHDDDDDDDPAQQRERERLGAYHGYAVDPQFLTLCGNPARITRVSNPQQELEQLRSEWRRRDARRHEFRVTKAAELRAQQRQSKLRLQALELHRLPSQSPNTAGRTSQAAARVKESATRAWQQRQQEELDMVRQQEREALAARHERVQAAKRRQQDAKRTRANARQQEKHHGTTVPGVGPSFLSTLRVDAHSGEDASDPPSRADSCLSLLPTPTKSSKSGPHPAQETSPPPRDSGVHAATRLRAHQAMLFSETQESLHLGGGYNAPYYHRRRSSPELAQTQDAHPVESLEALAQALSSKVAFQARKSQHREDERAR